MNQIIRSDGTAVGPVARVTVKMAIIFVLSLAIMLVSVVTPASAGTTGGQDLEGVRATVTDTYTYKIGLLTDLKAGTENPEKIAIYDGGIASLTSLLNGSVATEATIDGLWALKEQAHSIYGQTANAAKNAGMTEAEILAAATAKVAGKIDYKIKLLTDWIAGCDLPAAQAIVAEGIARLNALRPELEAVTTPDAAWAIKDRVYAIYGSTKSEAEGVKAANDEDCDKDSDAKDKEDEPTAAEKAAAKLDQARRTTLTLIERKTAILTAAGNAAKVPVIIDIFESAASAVSDLEADARSAKTIKSLSEIREQVMEIYQGAKEDVSALRADAPGKDEGEEGDDARHAIERHLNDVRSYVTNIADRAEAGAQESPKTYAELLNATAKVLKAADAVQAVIESGKRLDDRWEDLRDALSDFRRAVIRHYVASSDGPMFIGGFHIAG